MSRLHRLEFCAAGFSAALCILTGGCGPAVLTADDAIARPRKDFRLVAYAEREPVLGLRKDLAGVEITFRIQGGRVDDDETNVDGRAEAKAEDVHRSVDEFEAVADVDRKRLIAKGRLFRWSRDRTIIVIDVDDTLAKTEYEELILEDQDEDDSDPLKGSQKALSRLARDYQIAYVTARPRFLLEKTRMWLDENEFPPGPVITAPGLRQSLRPGYYKRELLESFRDDWPNVLIGIGDKESDAEAYGANKMLTLIVCSKPGDRFGAHTIVLRNWKAVQRFFEANHEVLSDPDALEDLIDDRGMLARPVLRWKDR